MNRDKKTILVVEDEAIIAIITAKALKKFGYEVITVNTGEKSVETVSAEESIDLVLMDINLGNGIDGTEAARRIMAVRNMPVVFHTSHSEREMVEKVRGITRYGYVIKSSGDFVLNSSIEMAFDLFEAHEDARRHSARSNTILKTIPDMMFVVDGDGYFRDFSSNSSDIPLAIPPEEIIGSNISSLFPPEETAAQIELYRECIKTGNIQSYSYSLDIEGRKKFFEARISKLEDYEVLAVVRDITGRMMYEDALREKESWFRSTFDKSPVGSVIVGLDKKFIRCNRAFCTFLGYDENELIGKTISDITHPDDAELGMADMKEIAEGRFETSTFQKRYVRKDGSIVWAEISISLVRDPDNKPLFFLPVIKDIGIRKQAQHDLLDSENRYRTLIELAVDGIMLGSHEGIITDANESMCKIIGCKKDFLIGKHVSMLPFTQQSLRISPFRFDLLQKGETVLNERALVRPDGSEVMVEMHTRMMPDGTYQSIYHDITERKRANEKLLRINDRFLSIANSLPAHIAYLNAETLKYEFVSDSYEKSIGIPREKIIGHTVEEVIGKDNYKYARKYIDQVREGKPASYENSFDVLSEKRWFKINYNPVFNAEGALSSIVILIYDISDWKNLEYRLQKSERKLETMLQTIREGMVTVDCTGRIIYCNRSAEQILGIGKDILGKYYQSREWRQLDKEGIPFPVDQLPLSIAIREQRTVEGVEHVIESENGERKWISVNAAPLFDENGKLTGGIASFRDITGSKLAGENIKKLLHEKELLLKEVHHRIKNNMNIISSLLILQAGTLKDPVAVAALEDSGNRVHSMMILYDRLYQSADFNRLTVVNYISSLMDEILSNFPEGERVKIVKKIEDFTLEVKILSLVGIIINELLTNIIKYAFPPGRGGIISLSASRRDNHVVIAIQDNGIGMPESVSFENTTGFGLELVKMLTEQLGGSIRILRGEGTGFVLEFDV